MADVVFFHRVTQRYYKGPQILREASFRLGEGEMMFLTGASGSGKSTLLRLIGSLTRPQTGQIAVLSQNISQLRRSEIPAFRRQIGIIFQNPSLLAERTVFDNVALPLVIRGHSGADIGRRVRGALDAVGLLNKEKAFPITLSGGEQQRAGIARAVVATPKLLLADEPTGNLDPEMAREVMQLFMRFNQIGVSVLVATHALGLIRHLPYRIAHLENGRIDIQSADDAAAPAIAEKLI